LGIIQLWHQDVLTALSDVGFSLSLPESERHTLLSFEGANLLINLISTADSMEPEQLVSLQDGYAMQGIQLVHLWEDVWQNRPAQVIGRIRSILGINKRLHGRKTQILKVGQDVADEFWEKHHLQGKAKTKYRVALCIDSTPVAIAGFSNLRYMKKGGPEYRSAELIRFATCTGYTVTGGFTKLLKHFITLYQPDDVMSYADRDWSLGKSYENAGFVLKEVSPPAEIWLDRHTLQRYFAHRLPEHALDDPHQTRYIRIFNSGNLKYVLYLRADLNHD
jgi:hypothetical protein